MTVEANLIFGKNKAGIEPDFMNFKKS